MHFAPGGQAVCIFASAGAPRENVNTHYCNHFGMFFHCMSASGFGMFFTSSCAPEEQDA